MGRHSNFPILLDGVKQIKLSELKQWGYLEPNKITSATLTFSRNGQQTGQISISVNTHDNQKVISLSYKCNGKEIDYEVSLVSIPSNLGKGQVWYFLCPYTWKRCRTLYLVGDRFLHREAFQGGIYDSQTRGKKDRNLHKLFDSYFKTDECYKELNSKYFKSHYNGRPTKRYLKIMEVLRQAQGISHQDIESMMML